MTKKSDSGKSTVTRSGASITRKYADGTVQRLTLHDEQAAKDYITSLKAQEG